VGFGFFELASVEFLGFNYNIFFNDIIEFFSLILIYGTIN
jgi:hypothetical protein